MTYYYYFQLFAYTLRASCFSMVYKQHCDIENDRLNSTSSLLNWKQPKLKSPTQKPKKPTTSTMYKFKTCFQNQSNDRSIHLSHIILDQSKHINTYNKTPNQKCVLFNISTRKKKSATYIII